MSNSLYWNDGFPVGVLADGGGFGYWQDGFPAADLAPAATVTANLTGVAATCSVGDLRAFDGTFTFLAGAAATGQAGNLGEVGSPGITGVQATAQILAWSTFDPATLAPSLTLSPDGRTLLDSLNHVLELHPAYSRKAITHGKAYLEVVLNQDTAFETAVGFVLSGHAIDAHASYGILFGGWDTTIYVGGTNTGTTINFKSSPPGTILRIAIDRDNNKAWCAIGGGNWNSSGTADPATGVGGTDISAIFGTAACVFFVAHDYPSDGSTTNFGQAAFTYSVPSGFTNYSDVVGRNSIIPGVGATVPGVSATGSAEGLFSVPNVLPGVTATCSVGSLAPTDSIALTGNVVTGAVGQIVSIDAPILIGVAATCLSGTISSIEQHTITGCVAIGTAGSFVPTIEISIPGVAANCFASNILGEQLKYIDLVGVVTTGSGGDLSSVVGGIIHSVSATGLAGQVRNAVTLTFNGVQATAHVGNIPESVGGVGGSAEAIGQVGNLGIDIQYDVLLTGVVCHAGVATPIGSDTIDGVFATGQSGLMRANPAANLYSVPITTGVGSFAFDQTKTITGVQASAQVGQVVGGIPQPLTGVVATGQAGTIAKSQSKTLTGVQATGIAQSFTNVFLRGNAATGQVGSIAKVETKLLTGVQANGSPGSFAPDLVTPVRYYLTAQSNFGSLVPNVVPTPTVITTGFKPGRDNVGEFGILKYNNEQGTFSTTSQLGTAPTATNGNSWRSLNPITGTISVGTWTISMAFRAVTRNDGQGGRIRVRIYRATGSNGAGAVEITTAELVGSATGALSTTVDKLSVATFSPGVPVTLTNEYLFVQVEWEIQIAGSNPNDDADFSLGLNSYVELPITAIATNVIGVQANGSAGAIAKVVAEPLTGVEAIGSSGSISTGKNTEIGITGVFCTVDHGVFDFALAKTLTGVQCHGFAGDMHSQIALIGSISLVGANANGFAGDFSMERVQPLTGNEAVGQVGDFTLDIQQGVTLSGVEATGSIGDIAGLDEEATNIEGVEAIGETGEIVGGISMTFDGVSAFAVAGSMTPEQVRLLRGVFATGFAGPVRRQPDVATALEGVEATGGAGTCTDYRVDLVLTGVEAQGISGELPFELTSLLQTEPILCQVGDIGPEVDQFWQGVEARGFAGRLHPNSALMDGAVAYGEVGIITGKGRSRGGDQRLMPRIVRTGDGGAVLWYDLIPPK